jgi:hypothetical protein
MARPFKQGIQYFPLDVDMFSDEKIQELNYQVGPLGEIVYIRILTMIYANGYYLKYDIETLSKILHKQMGQAWIRLEKIRELIHACLEVHLFDKRLAAQGVMTSVAIQKQFILSTKRRMQADIDKYALLTDKDLLYLRGFLNTPKETVIDNKNQVIADNNPDNVNIGTQKENKSDKKINKDKEHVLTPSLHFITKAIIKNKYVQKDSLEIGKYNKLFKDTCKLYDFDDVLIVVHYIVSYVKRNDAKVMYRFAFMKESLLSNLKNYHQGGMSHGSIEDWIKRLLPVD